MLWITHTSSVNLNSQQSKEILKSQLRVKAVKSMLQAPKEKQEMACPKEAYKLWAMYVFISWRQNLNQNASTSSFIDVDVCAKEQH